MGILKSILNELKTQTKLMKKIIKISGGSPYGDNEVINGSFDTDTNWSKATGWTISGGVASITSASGNKNLTQTITTLTYPQEYKFDVDVNSITGTLRVFIGGLTSFDITTIGSSSTEINIPSGNLILYLQALSGSSMEIDNVVLRKKL